MCVREVVVWGFGCIHSLASGLAGEKEDRLGILICHALWKGTDEIVIYQQVFHVQGRQMWKWFFFFL